MRKIIVIFCTILLCSIAFAQLSGTKTVGVGGDYATLTSALITSPNSWKNSTITGDVTFMLLDSVYPSETFPILCTIPAAYSGGNWKLIIKPVSGRVSKFVGTNPTTIFDLNGIDRLTLDSLIISNTNDVPDTTGHALRLINGASNNIVKNCILKASCRPKTILAIDGGVVYISTGESPSGPGNNNNLIENCIITGSREDRSPVFGVCLRGSAIMYTRTNNNNTVRRCKIYDFYSIGVYFSAYDSNTTVTENEIYSTTPQNTSALTGIRITATSVCNTKITRNKIYNFMANGASPIFKGIYMTMADADGTPLVANNFISFDATTTTDGANIYGIQHLRQEALTDTYKFYNNSIYIGGTPTSGSSYGFFIRTRPTQSTQVDFRDNIVFNNRSSVTGKHYCIYDSLAGAAFTSNYNDLYVSTPGTNGQYVAYYNGVDLATLANWQTTASHDANSISLNPDFVSATDLHISPTSTSVNGNGTPIGYVTDDIDGQMRNPTQPDIGADEYTPGAYTITATAFGGGTITPSGLVVVPGGTDTTFTITANPGHNLDSVVVDGANQGVITSYTFSNVSANHTIKAYFSPFSFIMSENTTTLKFNFNVMPNPFRNRTTIRYTVQISGKISLKLYNSSGRLIETLLDEYRNAGSYTLNIDNWKLKIPSSIYFLKYKDATNKSEVKLIMQ